MIQVITALIGTMPTQKLRVYGKRTPLKDGEVFKAVPLAQHKEDNRKNNKRQYWRVFCVMSIERDDNGNVMFYRVKRY